jgi:hypothetical protein
MPSMRQKLYAVAICSGDDLLYLQKK